VCTVDEYSVLSGYDTVTCLPCPEGADCTGSTLPSVLSALEGPSNQVVQQEHLVAREGWWASQTSDRLTYYQCGIPAACLQGVNGSLSTCSEGYGSLLCDVCIKGYYQQYGVCTPCPTHASSSSIVSTVLFPLVLAGLFGALFLLRNMLPQGLLKVRE
jgi:hypothetical protein